MLSFSKLIKPKSVLFLNSGLNLAYSTRETTLSINIRDTHVAVPIEHKSLEMVSAISAILDDARSGYLPQNAWENPEVKDLDKRISATQLITLAYYIQLSFLGKCQTRDIWQVFKGQIHHSLISYIRNRIISKDLAMRYKIAVLSCYLSGYSLLDIDKIERTFRNCGLNPDNYIFYFILILDGLNNFQFDSQESFILSPESMDVETKKFIDTTSIKRLCNYHTHKSLSFILKSHRMASDDLASELAIATQTAYTIVRPFKSKAYSENYARRAMTNTVSRILHAYTKYESKIRMVQREDGVFENTHIVLDDSSAQNIDSSFETHSAMASTLGFSEDRMIDYLDARRSIQ